MLWVQEPPAVGAGAGAAAAWLASCVGVASEHLFLWQDYMQTFVVGVRFPVSPVSKLLVQQGWVQQQYGELGAAGCTGVGPASIRQVAGMW